MTKSLYKPIAGVLNQPLLLHLSRFSHPFLELVQEGVHKHIKMFVYVAAERTIETWADGVGGYYEHKRRVDILKKARMIIELSEDDRTTFSVETEPVISPMPARNDTIGDQA